MNYDTEYALLQFIELVHSKVGTDALQEGRFVKDVFGRLAFIASMGADTSAITPPDFTIPEEIKLFLADEPVVFPQSPLSEGILAEEGIAIPFADGYARLLDRRIAGEDWMMPPARLVKKPTRIAFYGLKGGVGRSTALAIAAAHLGAIGKNVLVIDFDLEAPGLGSILLDQDRQPDYGVLDWFSAVALGMDTQNLLADMVGGSPFTTGSGVVDVVPAIGRSSALRPVGYFSKLARAYTPGAAAGRLAGCSFTEKANLLLTELQQIRPYDVVLIDVRAGMHETSASAILGLGAHVLLFGTNTSHTFADYSILLSGVRQALTSWKDAPDIRPHFRMVHGRASASYGEQAEFKSNCWQLWLSNLYDAVGDEPDLTAFSYDLDDVLGPHFPWTIPSSEQYTNFDPRGDSSHLSEMSYSPVFGEFLTGINKLIDSGDDQ
jgi:hypothetical protein